MQRSLNTLAIAAVSVLGYATYSIATFVANYLATATDLSAVRSDD